MTHHSQPITWDAAFAEGWRWGWQHVYLAAPILLLLMG